MTAQASGLGERRALLIGTGEYDALPTLLSPEVDCARLAEVLRDPEIGAFEAQRLVDADRATLERALDEFFDTAQRNDVCLLYLSCHGLSHNDKLYFAVRGTDPDRPRYSAISARFIHDLMEECRARSIVVILDCCYSGLFIPGAKGPGTTRFEEALAGHGRIVITAGTATQLALEGEHQDVNTPAPSRFTGMLVEGLRSGEADLDRDGVITAQELYRYAYERLQHEGIGQTPRIGGEAQYEIALAKVKKRQRKRSPARATAGSRTRPRPQTPWQVVAAPGPARQPVWSDGTFIVHENYSLHVIDQASRRRYAAPVKTNYAGSPAYHEGAAYFPGYGGRLKGVDVRTRKPRHTPHLTVGDGLLRVSADVLYAVSPDSTLYAIGLPSGDVRWSQPLGDATVTCAPEMAGDHVILKTRVSRPVSDGTYDSGHRVMAVRADTGEPSWSYRPGVPLSADWTVTASGIYVVLQLDSARQRIVALEPANGEPLWTHDTAAELAAAPVATQDLVIYGDTAHRLVPLESKTGTPVWEREKKTKGLLVTRPCVVGGTLFTADRAAELTAWKLSSGRRLRSHGLMLSPDRHGSPVVTPDMLYLIDSHGELHALPHPYG
ncbi:caspase, EACC1-associated type [Streptomyces sp. NPDC002589]|uniref:caspase, EACC1-associated type n=1 Tax=Streptomyces sp. NPDC002589 TaxID=3154420 RepID=UPI003319DA94